MAGDTHREQGDAGLGLDDEDRLPWLEAADGFEDDGEVSPARLLVMVLGGLLLIGAVLGGLWWIQNGGARGKGELIAAQQGDYKVAPKNDGAKTFEGEGDASFSASEGAEPAGKVDPTRMPEEPAVTPQEREAAAAKAAADKAKAAKAAKAVPADKGKAAPAATSVKTADAATKAEPAAGGAMIQLGAFSSDAAAAKAWASLSKRFAYLAELNKSVSPAKVGSGTVYRLRVSAGTAANAANLCGKLRVAGENCVVVR
ncbi:SPOR domain-containing protein [Sphingopyxis fribergensis]